MAARKKILAVSSSGGAYSRTDAPIAPWAARMIAPLTTNFSAWYAGNALAVVAFFLALATFGFYTSQAGRPIFQDATGERTPK